MEKHLDLAFSVPHQTHTSSSFEEDFFCSPETYVHPLAQVGPHVILKKGAKIGPFAVVTGHVTIGEHTQIHAHAIVGSSAQDIHVRQPLGTILIGAHTVIKEFVTISAPKSNAGITHIGDHCFLMHFAHVGHDAFLEDEVVMTNGAMLAGHVHVGKKAVLMAHCAVHQYCKIGAYSALAPHTGVRQDIPPYSLFVGQPAGFVGLNRIKLIRENFDVHTIAGLKKAALLFYKEKLLSSALATWLNESEWRDSAHVQHFIHFIQQSDRGVSRKRISEGEHP